MDLDCDELNINPREQRCDFVLAYGEDGVAAIELKGGDVELAQVARQLEGGGRIADQRFAAEQSSGPALFARWSSTAGNSIGARGRSPRQQ